MKKIFLIIAIITLVAGVWLLKQHQAEEAAPSGQALSETGSQHNFDKKQLSLNDPNSLWVIVNKKRPLKPATYEPADLVVPDVPLRLDSKTEEMRLRKPAAAATKQLFAAAKKDGLQLKIASAFRSYAYQKNLYNGYVKTQGQQTADTQSARPGHSEHQTGLALDVEPFSRQCEVEACFANTPEGKWVAANAYKHGFVVRYQEGKQNITGYIYEPWHLRYVGKKLARELHKQGDPTLEQFFSLSGAGSY